MPNEVKTMKPDMSVITDIATMKADMHHLATSVETLVTDNKEFHEKSFRQWASLASATKEIAEMKLEVAKLSAWHAENARPIKDIIDERKDNRKRFLDMFFRYAPIVAWAVMAVWISTTQNSKDLVHEVSALRSEIKDNLANDNK